MSDTITVGSKWISLVDKPWSAGVSKGDVVEVISADPREDIKYLHEYKGMWYGNQKNWYKWFAPADENQRVPYWDYMLKGGEGDKEMNTIEVGSEWVCTAGFPWSASLEPGDVAVIRSVDGEEITYWHGGKTWSALVEGWYDRFKLHCNSTIKQDQVNHPSHYNESGVECIDAIRATLGPDGFQAYCKGNCMKYLWRYEYKNGLEDLKKAQVYLNWMVESLEGNND